MRRPATDKPQLHPRNPHRGRYDFTQLIASSPTLAPFVAMNAHGDVSIDFADPVAVKALNRALLKQYYDIEDWDIPAQYLCPPIPGRADYLHYLADLLAESCGGEIPRGNTVRVMDIGVGANAIYPLIGQRSYGWHFVGTDVDETALQNARHLVEVNGLAEAIELRWQEHTEAIFEGVTYQDEYFALTLCNPPFHASLAEARKGSQRKWHNLGKEHDKHKKPVLNFGGQSLELCCPGGEEAFVTRMIEESADGRDHVLWFTSLVSKAASLPALCRALKRVGAVQTHTLNMAQGQKQSRILAWTFIAEAQRNAWCEKHAVSR